MDHPVLRFGLFELAILIPLVAGFMWRKRRNVSPETPRRIFWISLLGFETPIYTFLGWGLSLNRELMFLPLIGIIIAGTGLLALFAAGKKWGYDRQSLGTLAACGALSNQGYFLGGYLCLLLVGERGLALAVLFIFYWNFFIYGFLFPIARWSSGEAEHITFEPISAFRQLITDLRAVPLPGFLLGISLNYYGITRPEWIRIYLKFAPPVSSILVLLGVGLTIQASALRSHPKMVAAVSGVKFLLMPAAGIGLALLLGLDRESLTVVAIESACPTAVFSVVISTLFAMNAELAATLLVWTTAVFLAVVCPLLTFLFTGPLKP